MAIPVLPFTGIIEQTPDPYTSFAKLRIVRNSTQGRIEMQYTRDSGTTWKTLVPEPPTNPQAGLVLTINDSGNAQWLSPASSSASTSYSSSSIWQHNTSYADITLAGVLTTGKVFGFYAPPPNSTIRCFGMQLFLQSPANGRTSVDIVNSNGVAMDRTATIESGLTWVESIFATPLLMPVSSHFRIKLTETAVDSGEFISVRLILAP